MTDTPTPPAPAHHGEPAPTLDDPTAGGYLCGARRSPNQLEHDRQQGEPNPWPWCRNRAGRGTDHPRVGRCRNHAGNTPNSRQGARLRLAELVEPALATLARAIADPDAPWSVKVRAADSLLDRAGYPRKLDVDIDQAREQLIERINALQVSDRAEN